MDELQSRIREMEKQNSSLKNKVMLEWLNAKALGHIMHV